ncbi:MAG: hypothetical protein PHX83_11020 [Acidobacteriia bacterium]|nr:hypothetical protein [Terriglobia bacterium]
MKLGAVHRRANDRVDQMMEPTVRNFQDVFRRATSTNRHRTRMIVGDELDIHGNATFVNKFAPKPFIKDVLDGMTLPAKFNADSHGMSAGDKPFEGSTIAQSVTIGKLPTSGCGNRGKRT